MIVKCVGCGVELERARHVRNKARCYLCKKLRWAENAKRNWAKIKLEKQKKNGKHK